MKLQNYKILILGGNTISIDIVLAAKRQGMYTVVMDWYDVKTSPAKLIADEYSMISISDIDAVVEFIKKNSVNGVITGFTDSYLVDYINICSKANLPCYLTMNNLQYTLDKRLFKSICNQYGLNTIPEYSIREGDDVKALVSNELPVIFKPVDNSGSRGITKCCTINDVESAYANAISFSKKKDVLVEKFLDCDDVSSCYTIRNGEIHLSIVCDRYYNQMENGGSTTRGLIYPSKYLDRYIKEVDPLLKKMFIDLGFKNGVLFLQTFVDENHFYFYEMGYRLSGGRHYISTKDCNGVSALDMLLNFAITGDMGKEIEKENPYFNKIYCQVGILCDSKVIGKFEGVDLIKQIPNVLDFLTMYSVGDKVGAQGTSAQIVGRIHCYAHDKVELYDILSIIRNLLCIEDTCGNNIVNELSLE